MPVPTSITGKVTKQQFIDHAGLINRNETALGGKVSATLDGIAATSLALTRSTYDRLANRRGLLTEAFPLEACQTGSAIAAGTVYGVRIAVPKSTITGLRHYTQVVAAGVTAGQQWIGVAQSGVVLRSVQDDTLFTTLGHRNTPLPTPVDVEEGFIDVLFLGNNTTTNPSLLRGTSVSNMQVSHAGDSSINYFTANTGVTALPATITTRTSTQPAFWAGVAGVERA